MASTPSGGVSFIIPVYNKAFQLPPVLNALGKQEGSFEREYIFIDDGSTDDSYSVIETMTRGWRGVNLLRQSNRGSANATNTGLANARMPLVKFVDADDLLSMDATRWLREALLSDPDAVLAFGGRRFFSPGDTPDLTASATPPSVERMPNPLTAAMRNSLFNPTQFMAWTEVCRKAGGCDERLVFSQEYSLTLRLARRGTFLMVDRILAFLLDESCNRLSNNQGRQLQRVTRALRHFLSDFPDTSPDHQAFACRRAAARAWRYARRERKASIHSPWFGLYARSLLGFWRDPVSFIAACEGVYDNNSPHGPGRQIVGQS